jgi:hypothetical protein
MPGPCNGPHRVQFVALRPYPSIHGSQKKKHPLIIIVDCLTPPQLVVSSFLFNRPARMITSTNHEHSTRKRIISSRSTGDREQNVWRAKTTTSASRQDHGCSWGWMIIPGAIGEAGRGSAPRPNAFETALARRIQPSRSPPPCARNISSSIYQQHWTLKMPEAWVNNNTTT